MLTEYIATPAAMKVSILSIDAWNGPWGWEWNNYYRVGEISTDELATLDTDEKLVNWMVENGYLKAGAKVEVDDDQYNTVFCDPSVIDAPEDCDESERCDHTHTAMPVYAIAYGEAY